MTEKSTKKEQQINSNTRYRVSVFRSNKEIYAQIIDDENGKTLAFASSSKIKDKITPVEKAKMVGQSLALKAKNSRITKIYFNRKKYRYHGRVKALAEGLREGRLIF